MSRTPPVLLPLLATALLTGCQKAILERKLETIQATARPPAGGGFLKVHMKNGDAYTLTEWTYLDSSGSSEGRDTGSASTGMLSGETRRDFP